MLGLRCHSKTSAAVMIQITQLSRNSLCEVPVVCESLQATRLVVQTLLYADDIILLIIRKNASFLVIRNTYYSTQVQ